MSDDLCWGATAGPRQSTTHHLGSSRADRKADSRPSHPSIHPHLDMSRRPRGVPPCPRCGHNVRSAALEPREAGGEANDRALEPSSGTRRSWQQQSRRRGPVAAESALRASGQRTVPARYSLLAQAAVRLASACTTSRSWPSASAPTRRTNACSRAQARPSTKGLAATDRRDLPHGKGELQDDPGPAGSPAYRAARAS